MLRRPPRSTPLYSSAASDVYKRQVDGRRAHTARAPHPRRHRGRHGRGRHDHRRNTRRIARPGGGGRRGGAPVRRRRGPRASPAVAPLGVRLLLDNNLSPRLVGYLRNAGHDVVHVRDHGLQAAPDEQVLGIARQQDRTLDSADTDFGTLLARTGTGARGPSVLLIRRSGARRAADLAALLLANLDTLSDDLNAGAVAVVSDAELRVRRLPIPPGR